MDAEEEYGDPGGSMGTKGEFGHGRALAVWVLGGGRVWWIGESRTVLTHSHHPPPLPPHCHLISCHSFLMPDRELRNCSKICENKNFPVAR